MNENPTSAVIDYFATTQDVIIATTLKAGGEVRTPIWGVVVDGEAYIRNGFGEQSRWYRRVQRTHRAAFIDGERRYPVRIEDVRDRETIAEVDAAYARKYSGPGLSAVTSAGTRRYTMQVIPDTACGSDLT